MALDPSQKERVKELFSDWLEVEDQRKQLNDNAKELKAEAASLLDTKKTTVNKFFKYLQAKQEKGEDELDVLNELATQVEE